MFGIEATVPIAACLLGGSALIALILGIVVGRAMARRVRSDKETIFAEMIARLPVGVLIHHQGEIRFANPRLLAIVGAEALEDVVGTRVLDYVSTEDRPIVVERMRTLEETDAPIPPAQVRVLRRNGTIAHTETTPVRMVDFQGRPSNLVVVHDTSERMALLARLQAADRMAALGMIAAGTAHELNNVSTYLLGSIQLLAASIDAEPTPNQRERWRALVASAQDGAARLQRILVDLRTFSRVADEPPERLDVREVVDVALRMAAHRVSGRAHVVPAYGAAPKVIASEGRLAQVFLNLFINAAQAIIPGDPASNLIEVSVGTDRHGWAVVSIRDTGVGMSPDVGDRIFEPFFTTKPPGEGTGLGLHIAREIVTAYGGHISFESSPGTGTTFCVSLPPARGCSA